MPNKWIHAYNKARLVILLQLKLNTKKEQTLSSYRCQQVMEKEHNFGISYVFQIDITLHPFTHNVSKSIIWNFANDELMLDIRITFCLTSTNLMASSLENGDRQTKHKHLALISASAPIYDCYYYYSILLGLLVIAWFEQRL